MSFLALWLTWTFFGVAALCASFLWAVREGQLLDQQRAGRLALDDEASRTGLGSGRAAAADRFTGAGLALLFLAAMAAALWTAMP